MTFTAKNYPKWDQKRHKLEADVRWTEQRAPFQSAVDRQTLANMWRQLCGTVAVLLVLVPCLHGTSAGRQDLRLVVRAQGQSSPFRHFWRSTGFCPPEPHQAAADFDNSQDMEQNLAYIGSVPHSGIGQVRIHWLLDLIKVTSFSSGQPVYNFTSLDILLARLHLNGLRPGFEVMGSPSGIFTDMENKTQVYWFKDLVRQVAKRYIGKYGLDYVKTWNFETWNEPDCHDFDELKVNMTTQGFLNYYDACSEGLKAASPLLTFGGPGNGCGNVVKKRSTTDYGEALLVHVSNGTNYFTGEKGVRIDFISLHKKGGGKSLNVLDEDVQAMDTIRSQFPALVNKPYYNDEADPLVGWSKPQEWRATANYAAVAVKIIGQHQNMLIGPGKSPLNYTLLSNDNGFLSYFPHQFTQRTLVARFQMNATRNESGVNSGSVKKLMKDENTGNRGGANSANYVTFVRKPIHAVMALLAKLGDRVVSSDVLDEKSGHALPKDDYAGAIATVHTASLGGSDGNEWATVVYSSPDTSLPSQIGLLNFNWTIQPANAADLMLAIYSVNDRLTNPYKVWTIMCSRANYPSLDQFSLIRKYEEPHRYRLEMVKSDERGVVSISHQEIMEPEVILLHMCQKSPQPPESVTGLWMINITAGERLIRWSDANIKTKCIKTYEVEFAPGSSGKYQRINPDDLIVNVFVFSTDSESKVQGSYRVRAVDYWDRTGPYSSAVRHIH
ncbi:alpha-L-iduronidase-like isoform X2 [Littorina saxatilis]